MPLQLYEAVDNNKPVEQVNLRSITSATLKQLSKLSNTRTLQLYACAADSTAVRYNVTVVDNNAHSSSNARIAILIVPQSNTYDWLFSNAQGQLELTQQQKLQRLIIVTLYSTQQYASVDAIKSELNTIATQLLPANIHTQNVPYLSIGSDSDTLNRTNLLTQHSEYNGTVTVEQYTSNDTAYRQLVFNNNYVQGECRLKYDTATQSHSVDYSYLPSEYQCALLCSLALLPSQQLRSALCIGVGAGNIPSLLHRALPELQLDCVDIDAEIIALAQQYFGFATSDRLRLTIGDGVQYIDQLHSDNTAKYDAIMIDCNSPELSQGLSFPPAAFVTPQCITAAAALLHSHGMLTLNLGCRPVALRQQIIHTIYSVFTQQHGGRTYILEFDTRYVNIVVCAALNSEVAHVRQLTQNILTSDKVRELHAQYKLQPTDLNSSSNGTADSEFTLYDESHNLESLVHKFQHVTFVPVSSDTVAAEHTVEHDGQQYVMQLQPLKKKKKKK